MKKVLVVQFREDVTKEHERMCIDRFGSESIKYNYLDIFDPLIDWNKPKDILSGYDKLIVGGSAGFYIGPNHDNNDYQKTDYILKSTKPLLELVLERDLPTFGICFGCQLIANTLGTEVVKDENMAESGFVEILKNENSNSDGIFGDLPNDFWSVIGHQDSVASLPKDCILLASSQKCPIQAFRYGKNVYATQFHGELGYDELIYRLNMFPAYNEYVLGLEKKDTQFAVKTFQNFLIR
jgi:GMP synthase (glutamine-hydrolysing)